MSATNDKDSHEAELLRQQTIGPDGPGTILRDFQAVLEFIGPDGVPATGKYHLLPLDRLFELDERMTKPLRPALSRPQQKSFPHLNALYLLLRTTELVVPQGQGKKTGRLSPNPSMLEQWWALNDTEKYFNLLEAGLLWASVEAVGERGSALTGVLYYATTLWQSIPAEGLDFRRGRDRSDHLTYNTVKALTLAMLELFGLVAIETGRPAQGKNWQILAVQFTPFGRALLRRLFRHHRDHLFEFAERQQEPRFGSWQPLLAEYFPEWRNNLRFPEPEFRDGLFIFKASLGNIWRRIAIPAGKTLDTLAWAIIDEFDFDGDHLYEFRFRKRNGQMATAMRPEVEIEEGGYTDDYAIGDLPLEEGQEMEFVYDFGADWRFRVKLESIKPPDPDIRGATVIDSHGEAPDEYGYENGEWDD